MANKKYASDDFSEKGTTVDNDRSLIYNSVDTTIKYIKNSTLYTYLKTKFDLIYATAAQGILADNALPAASYTAADVLTKIKTVDGTGSGLDADLLDGKNTGTTGNVIPLLDGINTWSAVQTYSAIPVFNGGTSGATAPFSVDSTFLVSNLNADKVDGYDFNQDVQTTASPVFVTVKLSGLTDTFVPYHVSDATGLANTVIRASASRIGIGQAVGTEIFEVTGNIAITGYYRVNALTTVATKNQHEKIITNIAGTSTLLRNQTFYWDGAAFQADTSFFAGQDSGMNNSGSQSNGFAYQSLYGNSATLCNAFGYQSGYLNTASSCSFFGHQSGLSNTGTLSNFFGYRSGYQNTGGQSNCFGYQSGFTNTGAQLNSFGYQAGYFNTATFSSIFGYQSGYSNSGTYLSTYGYQSGYQNTGTICNFYGYRSGYQNTGTYCNFYGYESGYINTTSYNNAIGYQSLYKCSAERSNSVGYQSGFLNTGIGLNSFGFTSGSQNNGSYCDFFGYLTGVNNNWDNRIAIGKRTTALFTEDAATTKTFADTDVNGTNHTISIIAHGFGTIGTKVNLRFKTISGTPPDVLINNEIYQFTITSADLLTLSTITTAGSGSFSLTKDVDISNTISIGVDSTPTKTNQIVIGGTSHTETRLYGNQLTQKNLYNVQANSQSTDTIGDTYFANLAGVFKIAYCTVANAVKLAGTWVDRFIILANGNIEIAGFTKLGDTSIKVKKLTGTTGANEGDGVTIAHGLTGSKIISYTVKVEFSANNGIGPENSVVSGYQFHVNHDSTNFNIVNHATNSENILSKSIIITILYTE